MNQKKLVRFLTIILLASFAWQTAAACGPFTSDPYFVLTKHPDYPLEKYTGGKIGIIEPTFARSYLYVAYRQLNGGNFSRSERKNLDEYWYERIGGDYTKSKDKTAVSLEDGVDQWFAARKKITATDKPDGFDTNKASQDDKYASYSNCLPDAFVNAAKVLETRSGKYGITAPDVKLWVDAQDAVFSNCGAGAKVVEPTAADAPEWLQKDRAYQEAAALFYGGDLKAARGKFDAIGADKNSEWRKTAEFVAARTFVRQARNTKDEAERKNLSEQAIARLQKISNDPAMTEFHSSSARLINFVKNTANPAERLRELPEKLLQNQENPNLQWEVSDYTALLDAIRKEHDDNAEKGTTDADKNQYDYYQKIYFKFLPARVHADDLTDWIFNFQSQGAGSYEYAAEKWRKTGKTHWLIAAISKARANSANAADLIVSADKLPVNSPGYAAAVYHEIRLLLENDKRAEAKKKLLEVTGANFENYPVSTQNQFLAERAVVAENLEEYLKFAARRAAAFVESDDGNQSPDSFVDANGKPQESSISIWANRLMFDQDAVKFLNTKVPLSVLRQAALDADLPPYLRKSLITAVWTRALILDNTAVEREFSPLVLKNAPEFAPLFSVYADAANPTEREAAALKTVLNYPKFEPFIEAGYGREDGSEPMTIDSLRGNWWCADFKTADEKYADAAEKPLPDTQFYPAFLSSKQSAEAAQEQQQLNDKVGNSATYLARRALNFAANSPKNADVPEILHLAVRATRYGCTDADTGKYSKAAFTLLRKDYPNSVWTKKTPFWFH